MFGVLSPFSCANSHPRATRVLKQQQHVSVRNKPENSTCPAGNLKTNATCPPQFQLALYDSFLKMFIHEKFI